MVTTAERTVSKVRMCPIHPHYPLDLVCKEESCLPTLDQPSRHMVCMFCVQYGAHKGHRHDSITLANSQAQQQLDELLASAKAATQVLTTGSTAIDNVINTI